MYKNNNKFLLCGLLFPFVEFMAENGYKASFILENRQDTGFCKKNKKTTNSIRIPYDLIR